MVSARKLSPAQIKFLVWCLVREDGCNHIPSGTSEAGRSASGWYRTMESLRARGLVTWETPSPMSAYAKITTAGRDEAGRAVMSTSSIESLEAWKLGCVAAVLHHSLPVDDIWAKDDPYDLAVAAEEAFGAGRSPMSFIEEIFEEDLARAQHDAQQAEESMQCEFEEFEE
jgi:hypothetical protein